MNLETDTLEKNVNFDRFEFENVIACREKHASKRFENLKRDADLELNSKSEDSESERLI